ncbi:flagellar assembly protein FliH [Caldalkalibacillus uzonensis]|uniref:Flagellar assembly protein FliH n=1 Tax=Caldalkalibacillus uzonensis TaxID=353224 RepID=A0ABU0CN13_9BACI|nr:FliH/SctL family protein [Caldalkalibacillus uzonensis]MDQ0337264.1 flagellar assembly protein FliH [Caldalkalibacillus uzonensis]
MSNLLKSAYHSAQVRKLFNQNLPDCFEPDTRVEDNNTVRTELEQLLQQKESLIEEINRLEQEQVRLQKEASLLQEETQREIQKWWEQQEKELEQVRENAYRDGYEQGFRQGKQDAEEQFKDKIEQVENIIKEAYIQRDKLLKSAEPDLLKLSVAIARKVIGEEIKQSPEVVKSLIQHSLQHVLERDELRLHVPAEQYTTFLAYIDEWAAEVEGELKLIPDSTLTAQQCMLHTPHGSYDLSIDRQLEEIKKQLLVCCEERMARD